ncbi:MAG: hypothetical protein U0575_12970 [Phycisphaerales bacterium]
MPRPSAARIDAVMERASAALVGTDYFEAERLACDALAAARALGAFERMARICLPLQEARRQRMDAAFEAAAENAPRRGRRAASRAKDAVGRRAARIVGLPVDEQTRLEPGCWLVEPPLVGADARRLRVAAFQASTPALVVCREPMTRGGTWPIVAVGSLVVRTYVVPPNDPPRPDLDWFARALEAIGDAAIAQVAGEIDPVRRVDGLLARLDASPEHEKLHQALADACVVAARMHGG